MLSVIPIGRLPRSGARVVMESIAESSKVENPGGVVFISGQATQGPLDPTQAVPPMAAFAEKSIANLQAAFTGMKLEAADARRVTCFHSSLQDHAQVAARVAAAFPKAAVHVLQVQETATNHIVECEAVAAYRGSQTEPFRLVNPTNAVFAQAAIVTSPKILVTSLEVSSGDEIAIREAFSRVKSALASAQLTAKQVFYAYAYPTNTAMLQKYRDLRWELLDRSQPPASTNLVFEGLSRPGASLAVELMAAIP